MRIARFPRTPRRPGTHFRSHFLRRLSSWLVLSTSLTVLVSKTLESDAAAASVYWDINGNAAGAAATSTAPGTWNDLNLFWNDAAGTGVAAQWAAGDTAIFAAGGNATNLYTVTVANTQGIGGLGFEEGTVTLAGGTLQLTMNADINVASGLVAAVNSVLDGAFSLTKTGSGTLVLGGLNTYTGHTLINAGILSISADANLGAAPGAPAAESIHFTGSATLQVTGTGNPTLNSNRGLTIGPGVTGTVQVVDPANVVTYGGLVTGVLGTTFRKSGAGTLDLKEDSRSTFTGALLLDGGILTLSGSGALGTSGVTIGNRGALTLDNSGTLVTGRTAGALTSNGGTINFIANAAATTETLGALTLNAGALTINSSAGAGGSVLAIPSVPTRAAGGTLYVSGAGLGGSNQVVFTTAPTLANSVLNYAVVGNGTLTSFATHGGHGTSLAPLALASHNQGAETTWTATGATSNARPAADVTISGTRSLYTLTLDAGIDLLGPTGDRNLTLGGGILQTGGVSIVNTGATTTNGTNFLFGTSEALFHILGSLQLNRGSDNTNLIGTGGFTKTGAGILILNGVSSMTAATGSFNLNEGILELRGGTSLMATAATFNLNGATLRLSNDSGTTYIGSLVINADSTIQVDRVNAAATSTTHTVGTLTIGGGRVLSVNSSDITAGTSYGLTAGALALAGPATIDVANNGAGTGTMTVGTPSGAFTLTKTGAGDLQTSSTTTGFAGTVDIQGGRVGWSGTSGTVVEGGIFTGAGGMIRNGAGGTTTLTGANTFTGGVTVAAGTLAFTTVSDNGGSASSLGQGADGITLAGGALSFVGAASQSTNRAISLTASSTLNASGLPGATITFAGPISASTFLPTFTGTGAGILSGGLTQTGISADASMSAGTWTFQDNLVTIADDFTVTGATTVLNLNSVGVLAFGASADATLQIQAGATVHLGVSGAVTASGFDRLLIGQGGAAGTNTLAMGAFNLTADRLDIGVQTAGLAGNVTGTGTLTVTTTINLGRGNISADLAGAGVIIKLGLGDVTLAGDNAGLTGTTAVRADAGNLILDYSTENNDKLRALTGLDLRGGTLTLTGHALTPTSQTVASLTLASGGASKIDVNSNGSAATLNLGAITRGALSNDGTLRLELPALGAITTTAPNNTATSAGILGGWATVDTGSGVFFARNDGSGPPGAIVAANTTLQDAVGSWVAGDNVSDQLLGFNGTLPGVASVNSLRFNANTASAVALPPGGVLNIRSGGVLMTSAAASGAHAISGGVLTAGAGELIFIQDSGPQSLAVSSLVTGSAGVTKAGSGTLTLSGTNDYSGPTDLQAGVLIASGGNALGDNSPVTFADDQDNTLQLTANETIGSIAGGNAASGIVVGVIDLGATTLTLNQAVTQSYAGTFAGTGSLVKSGAGVLTATGSSTSFTGTLRLDQGQITLSGAATQFVNAAAIELNGAVTLLSSQDQSTTQDRIRNTAAVLLNNTALGGISHTTNQGATRNEAAGALTLGAGHNTITATATASSGIGTITFGSLDAVNNHATLLVRGLGLGDSTVTQRGNIVLTAAPIAPYLPVGGGGSAGTTTISIFPYLIGETSATGLGNSFVRNTAVSTTGLKPLTTAEYITDLAGYNGLSGVTAQNVRFATNPGTSVVLGSGAAAINSLVLDSATTITLTGPSSTLQIASGAILSAQVAANTIEGFTGITTSGSSRDYTMYVTNGAGSLTINSPLATDAPLVKSGAGTLVLGSAGNAFTDLYLNQGTVQADALGKLGAGALKFFGGVFKFGAAFDLSAKTINFGTGGGTLDIGNLNVVFDHSLGSGGGIFTKAGAGNLTLRETTTLTGGTAVTAGTVTLGKNQAIGTGDLTITAGAIVDMGAFDAAVGDVTLPDSATNALAGTGTLTGSGTMTVNRATGVTPRLAGAMSLIKLSAQTAVLGNAGNTFTGFTQIQNGTLQLGSMANAGSASALGAPTGENASIRLGSTGTTGVLLYTGSGDSSNRPFWLVGATGGGTIDNDGSGALNLTGDVKGIGAGVKVFLLQGTAGTPAVPNILGGTISELASTLGLTKAEAGTWALTAANQYTGATTVSAGTLLVNNLAGSGTGTGLVTVNGGTTAQGTLGGTGTILGGVTLATGGATSFAQGAALNPAGAGAAGTLTINTAGLTTGNFSKLTFDLNTAQTVGGAINDLLSTDVLPAIGASTQINVNALSALTPGLYTVINGYTGTIANPGNFTLGTVTGESNRTIHSLLNNAGSLQVVIANTNLPTAYWAGSIDGNWNTLNPSTASTNWRADAAGNVDTFGLPNSATDVFFYTTTPPVGPLNTTLGQNFTIKTLNFTADATSAVSINGHTLTITPGSSGTGISLNAAAGAVTINSAVTLGAAQSWTNNSANLLTVAGNVTGAFGLTVAGPGNVTMSGLVPAGITGLTKSGAGTLYLSSANGFTGTTNINSGGVVKIDAESGLGVATNDVTFSTGGGTWRVTAGFAANSGKVISVQAGPGTIQVDGGTLTMSSAIVGTSSATANGGGLIKTGAGTLALTVSSSSYDAQGVGVSGATGVGFRVDAGTLLLSGTSTSVVGDINPTSMTVQLNGGDLAIQTDTVSIARANLYVSNTATVTLDRTSPGVGIAQAMGTGTGAGLTMGTGSGVLNIKGGDNITSGTEAASFTGSVSLLVDATFNVTNATGGGALSLTLGALNGNAVARTITKNGNGTLILGGAATSLVDGTAIDLNSGALNSNNATALGSLAAVDVGDGTTFGVGASQTIGSLHNAGSVLNNGVVALGSTFTLTVGSTNHLNSAFTGVINGAGALTKAGNGTLTLSGLSSTAANNYAGLTTVNAGTLAINTGDAALTGGLTLGAAATTAPVSLDFDGVSASFGGALTMNINSATASTITVDAGKTLTVNGNVQIGASSPVAALTVTQLALSGGGNFHAATAAAGTFVVGGSTSSTNVSDTTLDLTALSTATINTTSTGTVRINNSSTANLSGSKATLLLPTPAVADTTATTTIVTSNLNVGDAGMFNNQAGQINSVILGTGLTTIHANNINVGTGSRDIGQIIYGVAGGDLVVRAADGTSRVTAFNIGAGGGGTATTEPTTNNLVDFTGHDADLLLTSLNVGNQPRTGSLTSEFKFSAGTLDVTNVNIGFRSGGGSNSTTLTNRVFLSGGSVTFGNAGGTGTGVDLGNSAYTGASAATTLGTLDISGGNVTIHNSTALGGALRLGSNVTTGGGLVIAALNLTGGTTTFGGPILRNATSPRTTSTIVLDGATAVLDMGGFAIGSGANPIAFEIRQGTIKNLAEVNGGVPFTKTTSGTLLIDGINAYTGVNLLQEGATVLAGGANNRIVVSDLTLGSGTNSATLQLGNAAGASHQTIGNLTTSGTGTANAIHGGHANFSTLTLNQSSNTTYAGSFGGAGANENNLNLVKDGAGELTVTGTASTLAGSTTVNAGKLLIDTVGAFSTTTAALTVGDGAEFSLRGSGLAGVVSYGFSGTGNKVTVGSGTGTAVLGFRLDGAFNTQWKLVTGQTMAVATGSTLQTAIYVDAAPTNGAQYVLIDGADAGSLHAGGGAFDIHPVIFNGGSFTYSLNNETLGGSVDRWVLTPAYQAAASDVWWKGDLTGIGAGIWSAASSSGGGFPTNWDDSQAGGIDALVPPDSGSIVHFSATGAANFATTLGANFTIQELVFHSGGSNISVEGSGLHMLTLGNTVDASGITLQSGAPSVVIDADVVLAKAQSFNVNGAGGTLTFNRAIGGTGPLGINDNGASVGTIILAGANGVATYTGATNLVAGRLILDGAANDRLPGTTALTRATLRWVRFSSSAARSTERPARPSARSIPGRRPATRSWVAGRRTRS